MAQSDHLTRFRVANYIQLMRLDKPIGIYLLLWPTLWALWFAARGVPDLATLVIFVAGVVVMRCAGCVINDYADRNFDGEVARTRTRPLADGRVAPRHALALFAALCTIAFSLVLMTNRLTILLSIVGVVLAAGYPFAKRFTHWPQVVLGAAFGWCIPMAYAAQSNSLPSEAWLLFAANLCWTVAYDTQYAMVDRDDDLRIGVKSTAILFGRHDRTIIGLLQLLAIALLAVCGVHAALRWPIYLSLACAALLFGYQQWLMRTRDRDACFVAFKHNHWVGATLFAGIAVALAL